MFSRLRRRLREVAAADDLTPTQTAVLLRLAKDGPASASQLAGAERVRPQSMAAVTAEQLGRDARKADRPNTSSERIQDLLTL
jgi:hypothetical protein